MCSGFEGRAPLWHKMRGMPEALKPPTEHSAYSAAKPGSNAENRLGGVCDRLSAPYFSEMGIYVLRARDRFNEQKREREKGNKRRVKLGRLR